MIERDVCDMLRRRANDVAADPGAWASVVERCSTDGSVPLAPRRRRVARPVVMSGLAAVVACVVASVAVLTRGSDQETIRASAPSSPARADVTAPGTGGTFQSEAEAAARRWVRAAAMGDGDRAWDLLATTSRTALGDRTRFDARLPGIAQEWGAWDRAPDVLYRTVVLVGDEVDGVGALPPGIPRLAVVIMTAHMSSGDTGPPRATSVPVRGTKDKADVDPFADPVITLDPDPAHGVGTVDSLGAITPSRARLWFVLDDREAVGPDFAEGVDGDRQRFTFSPRPALLASTHTFTAVALAEDGDVASRSAVYTVS